MTSVSKMLSMFQTNRKLYQIKFGCRYTNSSNTYRMLLLVLVVPIIWRAVTKVLLTLVIALRSVKMLLLPDSLEAQFSGQSATPLPIILTVTNWETKVPTHQLHGLETAIMLLTAKHVSFFASNLFLFNLWNKQVQQFQHWETIILI